MRGFCHHLAHMVHQRLDLAPFARVRIHIVIIHSALAVDVSPARHLNNIAVIEQGGRYGYCPIFDNDAGLLSNTQLSQMDIDPKALVAVLRARPFNTTFTRQMNAARSLAGKQLLLPKMSAADIWKAVQPMLEYYPARDRGIISVTTCILNRQKAM